jgi:hypothetical protein
MFPLIRGMIKDHHVARDGGTVDQFAGLAMVSK